MMINAKLAELAIAESSPEAFEQFCQIFASAEGQGEFVPLGGVHDGGADGYFESDTGIGSFAQVTKEKTTQSKINKTIDRLKEFGRDVKKLVYFTSEIIPNSDQIREKSFDRDNVLVFVRDRKCLASNMNKFPAAVKAAQELLIPSLDYLRDLTNNATAPQNVLPNHRDLSVYLTQEIERRRDESGLSESVCDSLILWALEGTDPDQEQYLDEDQIVAKVLEVLPTAKDLFKSRVRHRLSVLSQKNNSVGREINLHKGKGYVLPYATRKKIEDENLQDAELRQAASSAMVDRITALDNDLDSEQIETIVESCHRALHHMFELQGLDLSCFAAGRDPDRRFVKTIRESVEATLPANDSDLRSILDITLKVLRGFFYDCSQDEREYVGRLSRTYTILFSIQADPKIAEYFDRMSRHLILYVGTDILIRAISEYFLDEKDQSTTNLLKILSAAGAKLILTPLALQEVWTHMRSDLLWWENEYQETEKYFTLETASQYPRILMRAYMYAKLNPELSDNISPKSFANYLSIFVDLDDLRHNRDPDSLQAYLMHRFALKFETEKEFSLSLDQQELDRLTEKVLAKKGGYRSEEKERILAENDAKQVLRVYQKRFEISDNSPDNPFGFSVWWLTGETSVTKATHQLVDSRNGARYLMRPQFLLTYVSYAPKLATIRKNFKAVFPSKLGIRLSYRAKPDVFLETVREASKYVHTDESRARYTIRKLTNELKGATYSSNDNDGEY